MAIVTPHQSQAGIATANGGQAAPYRSASAFMTPGQAALPSGLNQLARGAEKLGDAVFRVGLDRMRLQNATDLLADKVAYEDALRQFDSDYRKNHLGASARDAEEAYAAFHQEQYDKLQKKWGGNKFLMEGVNRMAEGIRLPSMQKAVNYRDGQEEAYKKSVLQSSQAQTFALLGDPTVSQEEKDSALDAEERNLRMFAGQKPVMVNGRMEWQGGRDVGAEIMALRQKARAVNVEGFLARQDVGGAQRALDMASGGVGSLAMAHESGGDPGAISHDTSGSKSYGLFQFNNMGGKGTANSFVTALKDTHPALYEALGGGKYAVGSEEFDKAFRLTASGPLRAEMVQAQREHLTETYLRPIEQRLKGSGLANAFGDNAAMREVMLSTAIQHGPAGANRILREAWGMVDKDADRQAQLEQLITATYKLRGRPGEFRTALSEQKDDAARERFLGGMRSRYTKEEAQALALAHSGPGASLPPVEQARLQGSIDAARKRQEVELRQQQESADAGLAQSLVQETRDFSAADRARYLYDRLEEIEDPARRDKVRNAVAKEWEFQEQRQKAHDMADAMSLYETGWKNQETPTQFLQRVNASDVSEAAKKQALSMFNGKAEENELNMRALDALRLKIDEAERAGKPMSKEEIYKFAYDSRMTIGQTKDALSYLDDGGNLGKLKQTEVNSIYKALHPEVKDKNIPTWLYDAVRQMLDPGKKPTYDELKKIVARAVMNGSIPGKFWGRNDTTYGEALVEGKQDVFVAEDEERRNALVNPKVD